MVRPDFFFFSRLLLLRLLRFGGGRGMSRTVPFDSIFPVFFCYLRVFSAFSLLDITGLIETQGSERERGKTERERERKVIKRHSETTFRSRICIKSSRRGWGWGWGGGVGEWAGLAEALFDEEHELLLALVGDLHVLDELRELDGAVVGQQEGLARLGQKVDEVAVVARADVRQPRVRRVDVGGDGRVQQRLQRRLQPTESSMEMVGLDLNWLWMRWLY